MSWGICWNEEKNFKRQCKRKQKKVSICTKSSIQDLRIIKKKKKISHSDLCHNELSDLLYDADRSVEKIVEIMKILKPYQFEPKQEGSETDTDERELDV